MTILKNQNYTKQTLTLDQKWVRARVLKQDFKWIANATIGVE
jgi:hypothetical protein